MIFAKSLSLVYDEFFSYTKLILLLHPKEVKMKNSFCAISHLSAKNSLSFIFYTKLFFMFKVLEKSFHCFFFVLLQFAHVDVDALSIFVTLQASTSLFTFCICTQTFDFNSMSKFANFKFVVKRKAEIKAEKILKVCLIKLLFLLVVNTRQ